MKGTWLCLWLPPLVSHHAETKLQFCETSRWSMLSAQPGFLWQMHECPARVKKIPYTIQNQVNHTLHYHHPALSDVSICTEIETHKLWVSQL